MNPILECRGLTKKLRKLYCIIELKSISGQRTDYRSFRTKRKRKDNIDQNSSTVCSFQQMDAY